MARNAIWHPVKKLFHTLRARRALPSNNAVNTRTHELGPETLVITGLSVCFGFVCEGILGLRGFVMSM
jgi:hypothetical protein